MKIESPKVFPEGMVPLGNSTFRFACHPDVPCFTKCCRNLDLFLYPFDIIQLKNYLKMNSEDFLNKYVEAVKGGNPYFPSIMLKMSENEQRICPFLVQGGCSVYEVRPSACRTYPLERAVDRSSNRGRPEEYYFLTKHEYCLGHEEDIEWTVKQWIRDQKLYHYNVMDDMWAEMDTIFSGNPFQGEGAAGPKQLLSFMVCYNIDRFRQYVTDNRLLDRFRLDKARRRQIEKDDEALLKFGFDWLKFVLAGMPTLVPKS